MCFQHSRRISLLDLGTFLWTEKYVHTYGVKPDFQDKETAYETQKNLPLIRSPLVFSSNVIL